MQGTPPRRAGSIVSRLVRPRLSSDIGFGRPHAVLVKIFEAGHVMGRQQLSIPFNQRNKIGYLKTILRFAFLEAVYPIHHEGDPTSQAYLLDPAMGLSPQWTHVPAKIV